VAAGGRRIPLDVTRRRSSQITWMALLAVAIIGGFIYGFVCNERHLPGYSVGWGVFDWARNRPRLRKAFYWLRGQREEPDTLRGSWRTVGVPEHRDIGDDLQAVGYLSGYKPAGEHKGVTVHKPELAYQGFNLITSGHGQEAVLVDMQGRPLHTWHYDFKEAFPDFKRSEGSPSVNPFFDDFWRRLHLYPNGDLLAIYDGFGMIKLDKASNLIWAVSGGCHHDVFVDDDGLIYVLTREARLIPEIHPEREVLEEFMVVLSSEGRLLRKVSLLEAFKRSSYASFLDRIPEFGDIFHSNTVQVLDGSHAGTSPAFRKGNILTSIRNIDVIAILDMDEGRIVWALSGQWVAQHEPTLLETGNILIFDNQGHRGMSKVIEIQPFTQQIVWAYNGTPENGFFTESSGTVYRLPNGNTLIIESNTGRAFEVTVEGEVVWEYHNPHRAGANKELVATLFDVVRLDPTYTASWLTPQTGVQ
jgi:hypothetical protein